MSALDEDKSPDKFMVPPLVLVCDVLAATENSIFKMFLNRLPRESLFEGVPSISSDSKLSDSS